METGNLYYGWPEPIVPAQVLSNSGVSTVPQQYIRPPSERPSNGNINDPNLTVPVIDLSSFDDTCPDEHGQVVVAEVGHACRNWGFFHVVNHGVDIDVVKSMRGAWRDFFDLPMEEKKAFANSPMTYEGYGSRLGVEKGAILDWCDYYFLNLLPTDAKNLERWPKVPGNLRYVVYRCS